MKKIITTVLLAGMLTATFAGCSGNDNSSSDSNTSSDVQSGTTSGDTSSDATSSEGNSETSSDAGSESTPATEGKNAAEMLNAVFSNTEKFPMFSATEGMAMVVCGPDAEKIREVFPVSENPEAAPAHCVVEVGDAETGLTMVGLAETVAAADLEDMIIATPMMSAQLKQIIIVKPAAGKEEAVKSAISAFAETAKQPNPMEYPAWEAERAGTATGETANGYLYVVVAAEGADMGAAIENA